MKMISQLPTTNFLCTKLYMIHEIENVYDINLITFNLSYWDSDDLTMDKNKLLI